MPGTGPGPSLGPGGIPLGMHAHSEVAAALAEWRRVLVHGGLLFVAVPDLPTLMEMYLRSGRAPSKVRLPHAHGSCNTLSSRCAARLFERKGLAYANHVRWTD